MAIGTRNKTRKSPHSRRGSPGTRRVDATAERKKPNAASELRHRLGLSQPIFARLLPVSVRTLVTLEGGSAPTEAVSRRLAEIKRLMNALTEVIKADALGEWLQTPNPAFDGLKPLEVIDRGESDRLWSMIFYLRSGVPA